MSIGAIPVQRGCGTRTSGHTYWETGLSPFGTPIDECFFCPPVQIDPAQFDLAAQGVATFERGGVTHLLDWVGTNNYPNVHDVLEEIARFGLSRKIPRNFDFSRITPESKLFLVHARGWIENAREYVEAGGVECPKGIAHHPDQVHCCAGVWSDDLDPAERIEGRSAVRRMPSFDYRGRMRPDGVTPEYRPAIVAGFPLSRLVVVRDPSGSHEDTARRLREQGQRPEIVDE